MASTDPSCQPSDNPTGAEVPLAAPSCSGLVEGIVVGRVAPTGRAPPLVKWVTIGPFRDRPSQLVAATSPAGSETENA